MRDRFPLVFPPEFNGTFVVELQDDAMAPRVAAGQRVHFDPHGVPRERDGVMIELDGGALLFRQFEALADGRWIGRALNPLYPDVPCEMAGAAVRGVLVAVERCWSADYRGAETAAA
jgi:hypothetical protein